MHTHKPTGKHKIDVGGLEDFSWNREVLQKNPSSTLQKSDKQSECTGCNPDSLLKCVITGLVSNFMSRITPKRFKDCGVHRLVSESGNLKEPDTTFD